MCRRSVIQVRSSLNIVLHIWYEYPRVESHKLTQHLTLHEDAVALGIVEQRTHLQLGYFQQRVLNFALVRAHHVDSLEQHDNVPGNQQLFEEL